MSRSIMHIQHLATVYNSSSNALESGTAAVTYILVSPLGRSSFGRSHASSARLEYCQCNNGVQKALPVKCYTGNIVLQRLCD